MKVLFVLADNVYLTPYLKFYTHILDEQKYEYDVVFWDKNNNEQTIEENYYRFIGKGNNSISKVFNYIKYRKYILYILNKNKYDIVIPLHSIISFILTNCLIKNYKNRYIYDVRDYSFEKYSIFRKSQKKLVNNSLINIISSEGYKNFLPDSVYFVVHNCPNIEVSHTKRINQSCINISYIGLIRFMEQNKKILLFFKNDERFHLNFIGTNAENLKDFCNENQITNVSLVGTFNSNDTLKFYENTDAVMNLYGNNTPLLDYALSNKLYYSALLHKPILVCEDTYMETITRKYGIGFTLKMRDDNERTILYEYIKNLQYNEFVKNCDTFILKVKEDQKLLVSELINRFKGVEDMLND